MITTETRLSHAKVNNSYYSQRHVSSAKENEITKSAI